MFIFFVSLFPEYYGIPPSWYYAEVGLPFRFVLIFFLSPNHATVPVFIIFIWRSVSPLPVV